MPYARRPFRRSFRRRVRRSRAGSRSLRGSNFRARYSNRRFRRNMPPTGVMPRKYLKVKKDFSWVIEPNSPQPSWNFLLTGGAQTANRQAWTQHYGSSTTSSPAVIDLNGSTSLAQWFNFYKYYIVCGSKIKVELVSIANPQIASRGLMVTLVPTIGFSLAGNNTVAYDNIGVDPGELPYARRIVLPTSGNSNLATTRKMKSYVSVKKLLNVKDLKDVVSNIPTGTNEVPYVPAIFNIITNGTTTQPTTGSSSAGIYWNLVFHEMAADQVTPPAQPLTAGVSVRITQTSYIMFSDRIPLVDTPPF